VIDRDRNEVVDAIDSGSTNGHRLIIAPDGERLYIENEEDATVSVIDLPRQPLFRRGLHRFRNREFASLLRRRSRKG
jgi:DNA-binding beta-propeller fold protein YncE